MDVIVVVLLLFFVFALGRPSEFTINVVGILSLNDGWLETLLPHTPPSSQGFPFVAICEPHSHIK